MSTAATAKIQTHTAVEGMRHDVKAQIDQNRADIQRRDEENQKTMQQIATGLENLTKELNDFRLVNVEHVGDVQQQVSENFEQRLNLQSSRIDVVSKSVEKAQKIAEENAEFLQGLLVGVENLGENLKQFREEMAGQKSTELQNAEREHEAVNEELLTEVSLFVPAVTEPMQIPILPVSAPQFPVNPTVPV